MICSACGTENEAGRKFCWECGSPLARAAAGPNPPGAANDVPTWITDGSARR
jgi:hypothetical protein